MKKNWNKQKDKFNKKLNNIFSVIHLKKYIYVYIYIYWISNKENDKFNEK